MKVILTESQVKVLEEQQLAATISEMLNESANFQDVRSKIRSLVIKGVALSVILLAIDKAANLNNAEKQLARQEAIEQVDSSMVDPLMNEKVEAIENCMKHYLGLQKKSFDDVKLSPERMVQICYEQNFDLPLMLAQAKVESLFGLGKRCAGTADKKGTNSVWSVGSYDNGKNGAMYDDVNQSIEPYVNLMKNKYLRDRSIDNMLQNGQFTNDLGQRYASDPDYEKTIRLTRNAIIKRYPILASTDES